MRRALRNFIEGFKKEERGMTLVELLAVIVILAIVGAIAFVVIGNVIENSRFDAHIANAQQSISAAELHVASGGEINTDQKASELSTLNEDLVDPWNKATEYDFTIAQSEEGNITVSTTGTECDFTDMNKSQLATLDDDECE